jgi:hypothetical protein
MKSPKLLIPILLSTIFFLSTGCMRSQECVIHCNCSGSTNMTYTSLTKSECEDAKNNASDEFNCNCTSDWGD